MDRTPALGHAPRLVAAALAAGVTWVLFGGVVSLGAEEREQLVAAIASRQSATVRADILATPQLVAAAPAP